MQNAEYKPYQIARCLSALDHWFDTMRGSNGYTGPISHWWTSSLIYTGAMLDWRYESIICGYINLYRASRQSTWLAKARQAANDLCIGQGKDGCFWNSSFEFGAASGGTPHEAAADIGLLEVAQTLRDEGSPEWERYFQAAERNIQLYQIGRLWSGSGFKEQPNDDWLVANKNATALEALLLYEALSGSSMQSYIEGAAQAILNTQVTREPRVGATIHIGTHHHQLSFGIYTARCVSSMVRLMNYYPRTIYHTFIEQAIPYLTSLVLPNGTILGHYKNGRPIATPIWLSPSGEILRALLLARTYVPVNETAINQLVDMLLVQQYTSGGLPTAYGFASMGATRLHSGLPEFRDVMPVVAWCAMAFRGLTQYAPVVEIPRIILAPAQVECTWRGRICEFYEDLTQIKLTEKRKSHLLYQWKKGETYPSWMKLWS